MMKIKELCDQVRQTAYLKSARIEHGLLINFGSYKFEIRKFVRSEPPARPNIRSVVASFSAFFAFFAVK